MSDVDSTLSKGKLASGKYQCVANALKAGWKEEQPKGEQVNHFSTHNSDVSDEELVGSKKIGQNSMSGYYFFLCLQLFQKSLFY